jgi:hypothetical protein
MKYYLHRSQVIEAKFLDEIYFFKLSQPLTVSRVQLLYTVNETGGKPDRKPYFLLFSFRNPYRNLRSDNSQDYAKKPQRNCTLMNSASGKKSVQDFFTILHRLTELVPCGMHPVEQRVLNYL